MNDELTEQLWLIAATENILRLRNEWQRLHPTQNRVELASTLALAETQLERAAVYFRRARGGWRQ